ncbi:plasmid pRiA4b ORF-3 family protein [Billgrantia diversa]|uniref:plasmid pRiA4b ORF-3 family protein n=1 Tax=Halomonas sp. MCCC 1A13316 TaxID=2733487 RepID=UPI0018A522B7|nr:plasmid pRiA4b ORF-3 family protein [Halomonas sp. MCCC 1A13316]QOR37404.1 plasmid pRiA4b ORF-3 family protein [Halomonas sp. MCCC 1A13316]
MPDIRLRIELLDTDPLVWRRVVVPEQINLHRLHELIQDVMGWADCHLFEFECNGRYYGEPDEWSDRPIALARNAKLKSLAARAKDGTFHYLYDFGDGWEHRIVVEAAGLEETNPCPRLIDGAMACPPEDIGGTGGYAALKAAAAGEKDEYGQELLEALGGEFDPEALDEAEIAGMLEPFQAGFRRQGDAPRKLRPTQAQPLDMDESLKAQGINSIEELMQVLQGEIDKNR